MTRLKSYLQTRVVVRAILTIDEARVAKDWMDCLPNLCVAARLEKLGASSVVPVLEKVPVRSATFPLF